MSCIPKDLAESYGVPYLDFNLCKKEYLDLEEDNPRSIRLAIIFIMLPPPVSLVMHPFLPVSTLFIIPCVEIFVNVHLAGIQEKKRTRAYKDYEPVVLEQEYYAGKGFVYSKEELNAEAITWWDNFTPVAEDMNSDNSSLFKEGRI